MKETTDKKATFMPTEEAIKIPRWLILEGKKVAIGGDINIPAEPPIASYVIKEATQEEYKLMHPMYPNLIKKSEDKGGISKEI